MNRLMGRGKDGPSCPGCGLPNYGGLCPHCRGDQQAYEDELVPPFPTSIPEEQEEENERINIADDIKEDKLLFERMEKQNGNNSKVHPSREES